MEILLIGNGFDLEHDLPTHYKDFLDFCDKARRIYTFYDDILLCEYKQKNLDNWEVNTYIKEILLKAFENTRKELMKMEHMIQRLQLQTKH